MAYFYSASERAFFSSELMSVDAMPSDKVAVADQTYKQLMADQVAGKLIRTGSGNAPESVDQGLTDATRFGDVSFGKVTGTNLDINGNGDVSGTFVVGGAVTIKGSLNAQGGLNVTSITATGTSTLAAVNATNISASGTLKVNGSSALQAVSAKKITATEIDLNGSMDASGNVVVHGKTTLEALQANGDATIGGLLKVTGSISTQASVDASASRAVTTTQLRRLRGYALFLKQVSVRPSHLGWPFHMLERLSHRASWLVMAARSAVLRMPSFLRQSVRLGAPAMVPRPSSYPTGAIAQ